ncbi:hypothetical protein RJ639_039702 [Escallonia herrerae]|uniref:Cation/H+ exchanger domain-containing protein n=1 Tax=Escallonia herrerae TaxID=1293975 RepID=A0AA89B9F8_9ASTE|nr:hypothetical protein RJ639_039702 [Escallonia herrerae]
MGAPPPPKQEYCIEELFNPVLTTGAQVSCILVLSHFFQLALKPIGQPAPVAQILAGFVLGPSVLSRIEGVKNFFFQNFAGDYYEAMSLYSRMFIMFLIGLEMDVPYMMRCLRPASTIAFGGSIMCTIFGAAITNFMYQETEARGDMVMMAFMIIGVLANSGSPFVIRLAADLKIATSDVGRLAVSTSLISDMYAVLILVIVSKKEQMNLGKWFLSGLASFFIVVAVIVFNTYIANWLNRRNRNQKYLKNMEVFVLFLIVFGAATAIESMGFSSIVGCFLIGAMFPRGGRTARTLLIRLTYPVQNFIIPIYFGYTGFRADITVLDSPRNIGLFVFVILLCIGGKITGTLAACLYLKTPLNEGVLLAFLMNLKGHVDVVTLSVGLQNKLIPILVRRENDTLGYRHTSLEIQNPESELRMLACVHSPRPVSTMVGLVASSRGSENVPVTPYLMHLIELPERTKTKVLYHQREDDEFSDEEDYGGNDVVEINDAVDIFTSETGVIVNQIKVVSPFVTMYEDVCDFAEDVHASIILLPFHKHQRIDGKLESDKEGIRTTNQKVLRHAQCSVAILVDRAHTAGAPSQAQAQGSEALQHVATLFFGGPDDREALGFSKRLGTHHHINLTIIRFLSVSAREHNVGAIVATVAHNADDVLMAIPDHETDTEADNAIVTDFYNRYVTSGKVGYVEKYVESGEETASALRDMADMYTLFIVGKGGRGHSPLTTGMSDWEECPELGTIGDLLASSDFDISGSVLVIQQHRDSQNDDDDR